MFDEEKINFLSFFKLKKFNHFIAGMWSTGQKKVNLSFYKFRLTQKASSV